MDIRDRLTLGLWYKNPDLSEVLDKVEELSQLLGFQLVWKPDEGTGMRFGDVLLDEEDLWIGVAEQENDLVSVDVYGTDSLVEKFESLLKGVMGARPSLMPDESFLVNGVMEHSGPLLLFVEDPGECFAGIRFSVYENDNLNFNPQIRILNSSMGDLDELQKIVREHSTDSRIIGDNLWIDFWWSKFSDSWTMEE